MYLKADCNSSKKFCHTIRYKTVPRNHAKNLNAVPGILVQLTLIPTIMVALNRTGLVIFRRKQPLENLAVR